LYSIIAVAESQTNFDDLPSLQFTQQLSGFCPTRQLVAWAKNGGRRKEAAIRILI